jgi:hypothetical protein
MKNAGAWFAILLLVLSAVVFVQSLDLRYKTPFGPGPGMFPLWLSGLLFIVSLLYLYESVKKQPVRFADILPKGDGLFNVAATVGAVIVFLLVMPYTGFTTGIFIMLVLVFLRQFKWYSALAVSAAVAFAVFVLFQQLLGVPLPTNDFGW